MNDISGFQSALTGIKRGMDALRQDAQVIASQGTTNSPTDSEFTTAVVDLKASSIQVEASSKVLVAQDKMMGVLLDAIV